MAVPLLLAHWNDFPTFESWNIFFYGKDYSGTKFFYTEPLFFNKAHLTKWKAFNNKTLYLYNHSFFNGKLYLGTMVPKQAEIASSSIFGYHNLIKAKVESPCNFGFTVNFQSKAEVPSSFTLPSSHVNWKMVRGILFEYVRYSFPA